MIRIVCTTRRPLRTTCIFVSLLTLWSLSAAVVAYKADEVSPWVGTTIEGKECKGILVSFGPYDYLQRDSLRSELQVVEENHFSEEIERLESGQTTTAIGDIHYTLSAWPNHHRALNSALRYRLQSLGPWPDESAIPPAECYLQRAINFSPNDPKPYIMYGLLMHKTGQYDQALNAYKTVIRLLPNDIMTQYNMGLTLVELGKYQEAQVLGEKVYAAGVPLPGLKKKLIAAGHWKTGAEPVKPQDTLQTSPTTLEPVPEKVASPDLTEKDTSTPEKASP